jgi:hypothetical protein
MDRRIAPSGYTISTPAAMIGHDPPRGVDVAATRASAMPLGGVFAAIDRLVRLVQGLGVTME